MLFFKHKNISGRTEEQPKNGMVVFRLAFGVIERKKKIIFFI